MNHNYLQVETISHQRFLELWQETRSHIKDDENKIYQFFKPYIETIPKLVLGEYYWQIFNNALPFPEILIADGAVNKLTPLDRKSLVNASVEDFFSFYHQEDLKQALSFITLIFQELFSVKPEERKHYNITIYVRIKNETGKYVWNSLQYPALYFDENDTLLYGMALYTNVQHLMKSDAVPTMTVLNSSNPNNQIFTYYTSDGQQEIEKAYPSTSLREKEILALLSHGKASKQIADILGITKNTVDNHRQRLLKKFGVQSSAELVIKAINF